MSALNGSAGVGEWVRACRAGQPRAEVYRCHYGVQPFYLVHAPGRLQQPDLIQPCQPTPSACTPPGAFYALGWTSEDVKVAWDGHVVFLPGLGGNPPRAAAYRQLWPAKR